MIKVKLLLISLLSIKKINGTNFFSKLAINYFTQIKNCFCPKKTEEKTELLAINKESFSSREDKTIINNIKNHFNVNIKNVENQNKKQINNHSNFIKNDNNKKLEKEIEKKCELKIQELEVKYKANITILQNKFSDFYIEQNEIIEILKEERFILEIDNKKRIEENKELKDENQNLYSQIDELREENRFFENQNQDSINFDADFLQALKVKQEEIKNLNDTIENLNIENDELLKYFQNEIALKNLECNELFKKIEKKDKIIEEQYKFINDLKEENDAAKKIFKNYQIEYNWKNN